MLTEHRKQALRHTLDYLLAMREMLETHDNFVNNTIVGQRFHRALTCHIRLLWGWSAHKYGNDFEKNFDYMRRYVLNAQKSSSEEIVRKTKPYRIMVEYIVFVETTLFRGYSPANK